MGGGEFSIYPHAAEIMAFFEESPYTVRMATNALVYSKEVAKVLMLPHSPRSYLNISFDCGTREHYKMIKGVDGFDAFCENICRYAQTGSGRIDMKYVITADAATDEDLDGFINLIKKAPVSRVTISPERVLYGMHDAEYQKMMIAFARKMYNASNGLDIGGGRKVSVRPLYFSAKDWNQITGGIPQPSRFNGALLIEDNLWHLLAKYGKIAFWGTGSYFINGIMYVSIEDENIYLVDANPVQKFTSFTIHPTSVIEKENIKCVVVSVDPKSGAYQDIVETARQQSSIERILPLSALSRRDFEA